MCVGVEFLVFNVLLHTKSEQKVIGNLFCAPIINNGVSNKKYTFTICARPRCVWIVIEYFILEKEAFNGLFKLKLLVYK